MNKTIVEKLKANIFSSSIKFQDIMKDKKMIGSEQVDCIDKEANNCINISVQELLEDYNRFLLKEGYCDSDIYSEEPKAVDLYLEKIWKKKIFTK